jgi:hypothetical protein
MANSISFTQTTGASMSDSQTVAGASPIGGSGGLANSVTWTNGVANNVALGADTPFGPHLVNLAASGSITLTFSGGTLFTNVGNAITLNPGRVKGLTIWNIGVGKQAQDGTPGGASTICTVGGTMLAGAARPIKTSDASAALQLGNNDSLSWNFDLNGAGFAVTLGSTDTIVIHNLDSVNAAVVQISSPMGSN